MSAVVAHELFGLVYVPSRCRWCVLRRRMGCGVGLGGHPRLLTADENCSSSSISVMRVSSRPFLTKPSKSMAP